MDQRPNMDLVKEIEIDENSLGLKVCKECPFEEENTLCGENTCNRQLNTNALIQNKNNDNHWNGLGNEIVEPVRASDNEVVDIPQDDDFQNINSLTNITLINEEWKKD